MAVLSVCNPEPTNIVETYFDSLGSFIFLVDVF